MNKHAAEKIAQEYYAMGIKLAFEQAGVKLADPKKMDKKHRLGPRGGKLEERIMQDSMADVGILATPLGSNKDFGKLLASKYDMSESDLTKKVRAPAERAAYFLQGLQRGGDPVKAFNLKGRGYNPNKKPGPYKN